MQRTIEYTSEIRHAMEDAQTAHAKLIFLSNSLAAIDSAGEAIDANSVEGLCYLLGDAADAIDALLANPDESFLLELMTDGENEN